jgi:MYXO-CTERM domain-containing protein
VAGWYVWEGSGSPDGYGIGANIDIFSCPGDFEFEFRGRDYGFGGTSLAFTATAASSGDLQSVDIYLNSDYNWATDGSDFDVETVILHELGHALGLDHPDQAVANGAANYIPWSNPATPGAAVDPTDVMHSMYYPDGVNRELGEDERAGVAFLYNLMQGDADLDGDVDFADFGILASSYNQYGGWTDGNFNNVGTVDLDDFGALATNYGNSVGAAYELPEPAAISLLALGGAVLRRRRT